MEEIDKVLHDQNNINGDIKINYIKKNKKVDKIIHCECSSASFKNLIGRGKVYIGWERYPVYEDLEVLRCYKCQEFHHSQQECRNEVNLRKPLSSQELQEEVENLSEEEFRDFSDFSDIDPDYNNSNSELSGVSSDESNEDPSSSDNEEVMENEDDKNGTAPDPASNQFEFSWYDYSGNHKTFRFTGNEGIQVDLAKNLTPVAALDQFFSPELIVEGANRYAAYIISNTNVTRKSRLNQWYPTNEQEIRKFVGFYIWMGMNCRPAIASYWSTDVLYKNQVSQVLSRNRFEMLLRMIHSSDRENETNNDRLYKIRPVLDMLNNSFQQTYTMRQEMVIDESMIPWRGRLKFRQYIPTKSHKYGVKLFKLCSPSGYTWKCQIYTGRTEEQRPAGLG
ncbi:hypothetical protein JTB14_013132 [Gonioctena quinquepunctata]|nr:hypothetical protein JTB14_013132 [Gonioctena quinquepunctata]